MDEQEEHYTKLFVDSPLHHRKLIDDLAQHCAGEIDDWTIVCDGYELDVRPNESRAVGGGVAPNDEFLDYRYTVEVAAPPAMELAAYVALVARLMRAIHGMGAAVVAACDFEEELPGQGRLID